MTTLGERIRAARERQGLAQGDVAWRAHLPQQAVSRLECGERLHVRSDVLARLAQALNVSADYLLGLDTPPSGEHKDTSTVPPTARKPRFKTTAMQK
jgi:transcriptional regulator with XRE-family HTH domain